MPITNTKKWKRWERFNTDEYGAPCIKVARRAMEILDEHPGPINTRDLIMRANAGDVGLSVFQAQAVAAMIHQCHSRGAEIKDLS